jgi:uncharacterized membrane protein YeaQ/YmgE (transglycosylase-associated protein family)
VIIKCTAALYTSVVGIHLSGTEYNIFAALVQTQRIGQYMYVALPKLWYNRERVIEVAILSSEVVPLMDIVVLALLAVVVGFLVDLFVPGKRPWVWLLTMLAAGAGGALAGYSFSDIYPFIGNLSFWPALLAALVAAAIVRVALRRTRRPALRLWHNSCYLTKASNGKVIVGGFESWLRKSKAVA